MFPFDSCLVSAPRVIARCRVWMRHRHAEPVRYGHKSAFEFLRVEQILPYPRIRLADLAHLPDEAFERRPEAPQPQHWASAAEPRVAGTGSGAGGGGAAGPSGRPRTAPAGSPASGSGLRPLARGHAGRLHDRFGLHGAGGAPLRKWESSLLRAQAQTARDVDWSHL